MLSTTCLLCYRYHSKMLFPGLQWCILSYQTFLTVSLSEQAARTALPPYKGKTLKWRSLQKLHLLQIQWSSDCNGSSVFIQFSQTPPCKCLILAKDDLVLFNCQQQQLCSSRVAIMGRGKHKYTSWKETDCCHPSNTWGTGNAFRSPLRFPAAHSWGGSPYSGMSFTAYCLFHLLAFPLPFP